ncbi:MAG: ParA family protein [Myxococcales bacterium]|nr:ParA family protein [Myxococcales bacterium]
MRPPTFAPEPSVVASAHVSIPKLAPVRGLSSTLVPTPAAPPVAPSVTPPQAPATASPAQPSASGVVPAAATVPARPLAPFAGPRRLAIFNHKGGTGKTTTTVSIAAGLAEKGLKVLLVDTDSQGNVAVSFGVKPEKTLYHVLVMGLRAEDAAVTVRPNLDLIASNETLAAAELYLAGRQNRDRVLRDRLAAATAGYDVVVIDCSPSLSLMNQNALVLADGILVPVACDYLSLVGVRQVIKTVKNVNGLLRHPVQIYGVLPTFYDARARICRDAVDTLKQHFGDKCLLPIRAATRVKEAPAQGKTIFELAPESNASEDYRAVVERLVTGKGAELPADFSPASQPMAANA